ncbi:hypothetical protein H8A95_20610 [Bradyrhizobium sp. Pear76]|uniref:hypothetical protein n=1 Tax=Bradyrhizobium oropedii TaxID=1571201 RepID=UPI001E492985|nr:hypothetical protein [Bradyrhizobium oropedii]MCC8964651.1 hypothetical protein [Bradyrhizobium oropedii]
MRNWKSRVNCKHSLIRDQRGVVAFEMPFVFFFLFVVILLPLVDLAIAGFQYITAWEALRAFGQSIQYDPPPDVTNAATWQSTALAKADTRYPISNFQLFCVDTSTPTPCSSANTNAPTKYYSYSTSFTLAPMVLRSLCGSSCTITLYYSERFQ